MAAEGGAAEAAVVENVLSTAAAELCFPGQPVAFSFAVDGDETRMFPGALADHVRLDAPRLSLLLEAGVWAGGDTVWMVEYDDGDLEAVRAENVPAGTAAYHCLLDGAVGLEGEAGAGDDDDGAPRNCFSVLAPATSAGWHGRAQAHDRRRNKL